MSEGVIIDGSFVEVPHQRNTREENKDMKKAPVELSIAKRRTLSPLKTLRAFDSEAENTERTKATSCGMRRIVKFQLLQYMGNTAKTKLLQAIDEEFCIGFPNYLKTATTSVGTPLAGKIPNIAKEWMPKPTDSPFVFANFPTASNIDTIIRRWVALSGIKKHVTFHTARHSFATMGLTLGTDLYTVSKLLGHKSISTTQVYAQIIDKKKDEASDLLDNAF